MDVNSIDDQRPFRVLGSETMAMTVEHNPSLAHRLVRLDTLVRLRWLAVAGQTAAVLIVAFWLDFPLPIYWCLGLIGLSAWLNLFLKIRYPSSRRLSADRAAVLLAVDILQLSGLLYLTGGLTNPFALLLIAPVTVSATALPPQKTMLLGVLAVVAATLLGMFHQPLPWHVGGALTFPALYVFGVWFALVSGLIFIAVYTFRVADEGRQLADALAATELVLAREQHLSSLDGLAAAAAHELGTPLATIVLTAKELASELGAEGAVADDIALIRSQSERCREILSKLTSLSSEPDEHYARMSLRHLLEEVAEPNRDFGVAIDIVRAGATRPEPVGVRNPAILYGLGNIVENAADFADSTVTLRADWDDDTVTVTVTDDGPGFSPGVLARLGEPYVTSRGRAGMNDGHSSGGGLGLGFFIARTLLERTGAQVEIGNRGDGTAGAVVRIVWPRAALDVARSTLAGEKDRIESLRMSTDATNLPDGI